MPTREQVLEALSKVADPNTGKGFVASKAIRDVQADGQDVAIDVVLGYPARSQHAAVRESLQAAAKAVEGVRNVSVAITTRVVAHAVQRGVAGVSSFSVQ